MPRVYSRPEDAIQERAVSEMRGSLGHISPWPVFHCPNEGRVSKAEASKRARQGVTAGVPDLVIVWPTVFGHPGAALELKAERGRVTQAQRGYLEHFARAGFATAITRGHEETALQLAAWGYIPHAVIPSWLSWASRQRR